MPEIVAGIVTSWHGSIASIPSGWALCNGTQGTPDLRDKFVPGAGTAYNPADSGGNVNHTHPFTGDGHSHVVIPGSAIGAGPGLDDETTSDPTTGTTDNDTNLPTYYSLAYIMKL